MSPGAMPERVALWRLPHLKHLLTPHKAMYDDRAGHVDMMVLGAPAIGAVTAEYRRFDFDASEGHPTADQLGEWAADDEANAERLAVALLDASPVVVGRAKQAIKHAKNRALFLRALERWAREAS